MKKTLRLAAPTLVAVASLPGLVLAQEEGVERIANLGQLIRWSGVVTSVFVIIIAFVLLRFMGRFVDRLSEQFAIRRLLFQKFETIFQFLVYVGTGIGVTMLSLRLDRNVIAVLGGTAAVSVGFAIKDLVAAFFAGIVIMFDRPFQVGDRVSFDGQYGDITAIGLRSVRMQTLDDNTVTIPNNKFLNDVTSSGNYGALDMQVVMDFFVGPDQDVDKAQQIITEAAVSSRHIFLPKPVVVLVNQVLKDNYVAVRLRLKAYVNDTQYERAFETDVHLRVLAAFREVGIGPPAVLHRQMPAA